MREVVHQYKVGSMGPLVRALNAGALIPIEYPTKPYNLKIELRVRIQETGRDLC